MGVSSTGPTTAGPTGTQSIERAAAVLRALLSGEHGVSDVAATVGLHVSTTHRILRGLLAEGLVEQDIHNDRYRLGPAAIVLGQAAGAQRGFGHIDRALRGLADECGLTSTFSVRRNAGAVILATVAPGGEAPKPGPGHVEPYHAGAAGKVLLAWSGVSSTEAIAGLDALDAMTERTVVDRAVLREVLDAVAGRGFAVDDGETQAGRRAVAAPVLDPRGFARAAVSVGGAVADLPTRSTARIARILAAAAASLAATLPLDRY